MFCCGPNIVSIARIAPVPTQQMLGVSEHLTFGKPKKRLPICGTRGSVKLFGLPPKSGTMNEIEKVRMQIKLCEAWIVTENTRRRLTKSMARQFPIRRGWARQIRLVPLETPVCKIRGKAIGHRGAWLYLIPDDEAGYIWLQPAHSASFTAEGGVTFTPDMCPTVIL